MVAGRLHLRVAQLHQDFRGPGTVSGRQIGFLREFLCRPVMRHRFLGGAAALGDIARRDPMG